MMRERQMDVQVDVSYAVLSCAVSFRLKRAECRVQVDAKER